MSATRFTAVHFCDVAPPLINGVVRAVSDLMQAQRQLGSHAFAIAPASRGDIPGGMQIAQFSDCLRSGYRRRPVIAVPFAVRAWPKFAMI